MTRNGFIEDNIPREEELPVQIAYQPAKTILSITNEDSFKTSCGTFAADLLRLVDEALAAEDA
jgi:hypothetical protein